MMRCNSLKRRLADKILRFLMKKNPVKYINALESAYKVFKEEPDLYDHKYNQYGLCYYWSRVFKLNQLEIFALLGDKFKYFSYSFGGGEGQVFLYINPHDFDSDIDKFFERSNWCKKRLGEIIDWVKK